jgi:hypothetical protein
MWDNNFKMHIREVKQYKSDQLKDDEMGDMRKADIILTGNPKFWRNLLHPPPLDCHTM